MIPAMEVTDRPLFALIPVLAAALAVIIVGILQGGEDAVAVGFPSFLTILPLLRATRTASYLAAGLLAVIGAAEFKFGVARAGRRSPRRCSAACCWRAAGAIRGRPRRPPPRCPWRPCARSTCRPP
jgi:hypothetical protein